MDRVWDVLDDLSEWYVPGSPAAGAAPRASLGVLLDRSVDPARRGFVRVLETLLTWRERARQRRTLLELSDHMLRDIGISRADAHGEALKPFWRV